MSKHCLRRCFVPFILLLISSCHSKHTLFNRISSSHSGIRFENTVTENDSINPIDLEFLYNGGGVAAADFNNDGKTDLYFTASTVSNKLYLNEGDFTFNDVTGEAKVTGEGLWANGAAVVDINNDGWMDIYVSNSIKSDPHQRRNLLYINQGTSDNKIPVFKEMAADYGLADTSLSVQAAFFDYDNDGDLDMYLMTTKLAKREGARFFSNNGIDTVKSDVDKLFRNDWSDSLQHPFYTDVSAPAGITHPGFGLGVAIADINKDGWKDIYVTNDFYGSDLLYINNKNGTFSEEVNKSIGHTSQNAMGNDIADINNDGLADIIAVDMNPEDNFRKKKNMGGANYNIYQNQVFAGYSIQYVRNTLQLNMGPSVNENDSLGNPVFGDISFFAGVAETDWSWNPSLADFDYDGWRDLIITNGYPRDVTDHDFAAYRSELGNIATKQQLIDQIPQIRISNYAFRNDGRLHFENVTKEWGMDEPSFSNGAAYADLDNDGYLYYVINNINEEAMVYENTLIKEGEKSDVHFVKIKYKGPQKNPDGLGVIAELYNGGQRQIHENFPYRGYLSTVECKTYFGLGNTAAADSLKITWPDGKVQLLANVEADKEITIDYSNSGEPLPGPQHVAERDFTDITGKTGAIYEHHEVDYVDYNDQRLLPHKLSQYGPGIAAGDIDGNGFDDMYIGGSGNYEGKFFLQQKDGTFNMQSLPRKTGRDIRYPENMATLFFDADGDGDLDVYFASGSSEHPENSRNYGDEFLVNDGKGKLHWDTIAIPDNYASKSCVRAADMDRDGDLDLFIGGRTRPGHYPLPASSFIYRNDSKNGKILFTDVTAEVAPVLKDIGMVCDALWTDHDNDGLMDLLLAGEWMPITVLKNTGNKFTNVTSSAGLLKYVGWWNSIAAGDFDNDGDMDYIVGNLGTNSYLRASDQYPVKIYQKDFDNNDITEIIPTIFIKDENGNKREFTINNRDEIMEQLPGLKKNFLTYKEFGRADVHTILGNQLNDAFTLTANYFKSVCLSNDGKGHFTVMEMTVPFQLAPVFGMVTEDFNADGNLDIAVTGNDYGNEVANGRYDAINGIVAYGNGKGKFLPEPISKSGLFIPGNGKSLVKLRGSNGQLLIAASQNRGPLKIFAGNIEGKPVALHKDDRYIIVHLKDGRRRREEIYHGSSFISQSSCFYFVNDAVRAIDIFNAKNEKRTVTAGMATARATPQ
jgi:hypothetical protein